MHTGVLREGVDGIEGRMKWQLSQLRHRGEAEKDRVSTHP